MRSFSLAAAAKALVALLPVVSSAATGPAGAPPGQTRKFTCAHGPPAPFPEVQELFVGNQAYINELAATNPRLLYDLANEGQKPPFLLIDCSDSRVNEQGIFSAPPGTLFTTGNIANQFDEADVNANSVLAYAVETLKVRHVVVMGHYGCGGVAASMMPPPASPPTRSSDIALNTWIAPIRKIYETSARPEIVAHRQKTGQQKRAPAGLPDLHDPAFRAMVEENVKANVDRLAKSFVIRDHYTQLAQSEIVDCPPPTNSTEEITEVYIHGWVYDVENGVVSDLGVTVGPPGVSLPKSPFPTVQKEGKCAA